jgi:hypothetical protein
MNARLLSIRTGQIPVHGAAHDNHFKNKSGNPIEMLITGFSNGIKLSQRK